MDQNKKALNKQTSKQQNNNNNNKQQQNNKTEHFILLGQRKSWADLKLHGSVYDILPPITAITGYAIDPIKPLP